MAYRRSIIARTKSFYQQQQRLVPSFSHFSTSDRQDLHTNCSSKNSEIRSYIHNRLLITRNCSRNSQLSRNVISQIGTGYGLVSHRNLSGTSGGESDALKNTEVLNDVAGVVGDKAVEVAPVMNEVAVVAADSFSPVAALQYLVDHVHCYTGFNWWASIVVTTLLLRSVKVPLFVYKKIFFAKHSQAEIRKLLDQVQVMAVKGLKSGNWNDLSDCEKEFEKVFGGSDSKLDGYAAASFIDFISDVTMISFFFAILNMAEKVPSFVTGGTLWFTDLTTPDSTRLPILLALTFWIRLELDSRHFRVKGGRSKNTNMFCGALALLGSVTLGLPKAIYCYGITSNLFSIALSIVMMDPQVLKLLGISTDK